MVRSVAIIQPDREVINSSFLQCLVESDLVQYQISRELSQLAQANLFQANIKSLVLVLPSLEEQLEINNAINAIDKLLNERVSFLKKNQSLKKSLMQDLLTGKVRVTVN